jgi:hypothetical protein
MRIPALALTFAAGLASAPAQTQSPDTTKPSVEISARETALDNLLSERETPEAFDATVVAARKAGVSEQAILEARFLFHVDRREDESIAALLPEFIKANENFNLEDSAIFAVKEDWLAVVEYVHAIAALGKGDKDAFKQHITEAFWLGPRQAAAFAPHIERLRLEEAMDSVKLDFATPLAPLAGGEPVTLGKLIEGKKALLLHFWSPRSRECEVSMPDFVTTATLVSNGVSVASLVSAGSPEILTEARALIRPHTPQSLPAPG